MIEEKYIQNDQDNNDSNSSNTLTTGDDRTRLQALSLINDCYKYIMDLTTNGVVITDAIKFVQTNKDKLTDSYKKEDEKESKDPDYNEDKNQLEEETGELPNNTTIPFESILNYYDNQKPLKKDREESGGLPIQYDRYPLDRYY